MVDTSFRVKNDLVVNNTISVNSTAIYLNATNTATINSTFYTGTANNALFINGISVGGFQTVSGLPLAVSTLSVNNAVFLNGQPANTYVTFNGLASNVATLQSNSANFIGTIPASNVVTNTFLSSSYAPINAPSFTNTVNIGNTGSGGSLICNGAITSTNNISDSIGPVRSIPVQNKTAAYTIANSDNGQTISINTGPITLNGAFVTPGFAVTVFNDSSLILSISAAAGTTIYLAGTNLVGNRIVNPRGLATILCVASNIFVVTGAGVY